MSAVPRARTGKSNKEPVERIQAISQAKQRIGKSVLTCFSPQDIERCIGFDRNAVPPPCMVETHRVCASQQNCQLMLSRNEEFIAASMDRDSFPMILGKERDAAEKKLVRRVKAWRKRTFEKCVKIRVTVEVVG